MAGAIDGGSSSGGSPSLSPPLPKLSLLKIAKVLLSVAVLLLPVALVVGLVVVLCARAKKARRNKEDRRRLKKRVNWLRHLLPLLHPAPAASEENDDKESGGATTATAQAVRTVLARRLDATVVEADRLATWSSSWGMSCGLARCDAQAKRLEQAGAAVDEVYVQVLPVVSQIDATESVVQMLGVLQRRTLRSQHGGDDDGNPLANCHTQTPSMQGPDGRTEFYDQQPLLCDDVVDDQASTGTETA